MSEDKIMSAQEVAEKMRELRGVEMKLGDWATLHAALVGCLNTANENLAMGRNPWPTTDMGKGREDLNQAMQQNTLLAAASVVDLLEAMLRSEFDEAFERGAPRLHGVASDTRTLN